MSLKTKLAESRRALISRIIAPVLLSFLWFVITAVSNAQAQVLDFIVEMNQAGAHFTVQANNATTLHWMGREGSRSTESSDALTVSGSGSWDDPPDDKPHKPYGVWPRLDTLIESVSWLPLYAQEMVVGYRFWLSLQEDSLSIKGFSWWTVVAVAVLGVLTRTWWHSGAPLFNQWEEQQQHRVSDLKIITCIENHPPGPDVYPQGGGGSGVSNQREGGGSGVSNQREGGGPGAANQWGWYGGNGFRVYSDYGPSGGGGGGHYPHYEHTYNYRPCPACSYRQPCQYAIVNTPSAYTEQPGSSMSGAMALSHYPPEPGAPMNHGVGNLFEYQGGNVIAEAISSETGRGFTQQEPPDHEPGCLCEECFAPLLEGSDFSSGVESTAASLQASVQPPAPGWPSDHNPNDLFCRCQRCLDLLIGCVTTSDGQGIDCVAEATFSGRGSGDLPGTGSVIVSSETSIQSSPGSFCTLPWQLSQHLKQAHATEEQKTHQCPHEGCDKVYALPGQLTRHLKQAHATEEQKAHQCPHEGCDKAYALPGQLTRHLKQAHATEEQKTHQCPHKRCDKAYVYPSQLTEHLKLAHGTEEQKTHQCPHKGCDKAYVYPSQLAEHLKQAHATEGQKIHQCPHEGCGKAYALSWQLTTHLKQAHATEEQKTHQCPHKGCDKAYVYPSQLTEHLKQAHATEEQKTHQCPHKRCGKAYALSWQLTQHLNQAHTTEEQKTHQCPHEGCDKVYALPGQLTRHLKQAHATEEQKTHQCPHKGCDKAYVYPSQLTTHLKQAHATERPVATVFPRVRTLDVVNNQLEAEGFEPPRKKNGVFGISTPTIAFAGG